MSLQSRILSLVLILLLVLLGAVVASMFEPSGVGPGFVSIGIGAVLLAIVGAVVGNAHQVYQLTGAAAGFAVGTTVSKAIMKLVYPTDEEGAHG